MEREEALKKLNKLVGKDLRILAEQLGITVWRGDKKNKGWAGHTIERYLNLPLNSAQSPNFGSWELKIVPLKMNRYNNLVVKETMAITMLDPFNVKRTKFIESHLYAKLKKAIVCARVFESQEERSSILYKIAFFDLNNTNVFNLVKQDYEEVQYVLNMNGTLSGKMGRIVQPRTKGPGHGSISRAFYARTKFVSFILGLTNNLD